TGAAGPHCDRCVASPRATLVSLARRRDARETARAGTDGSWLDPRPRGARLGAVRHCGVPPQIAVPFARCRLRVRKPTQVPVAVLDGHPVDVAADLDLRVFDLFVGDPALDRGEHLREALRGWLIETNLDLSLIVHHCRMERLKAAGEDE